MKLGYISKRIKNKKYKSEIIFWRNELRNYVEWYNGKKELYNTPSPSESQKVISYTEEHSAVLTWFELHQKPKYIQDLKLTVDCFRGKKIIDIGSGPFPNSLVFNECEVYNLDPLLPKYIEIGFPLFKYESRAKYIYAYSESIPVEDNIFDAVISVNAIDHVDDFEKTAIEVQRVLKPNGLLKMHVHYHEPTLGEPIRISDERFRNAYSWCCNLKKISESQNKMGHKLNNEKEKYVLWSNF